MEVISDYIIYELTGHSCPSYGFVIKDEYCGRCPSNIQHPLESRSDHIINGILVEISSVRECVCVVTISVAVSLEDEFKSPGS
jgi:hypothetical protein